jgi:hypothetical protein
LEDGIWAKIMEVDAIKGEEMMKELRGRERQATLQEAQKDDELTGLGLRLVLAGGDPPFPRAFL